MTARQSILAGLAVLLLTACGASDTPAPGEPAHHTVDGFRNLPGSPEPVSTLFGDRLPFFARMLVADLPVAPPGHALGEAEAIAGWQALGGRDGLAWLGHAAFLVRLRGRTILTDPFLGETAGPGIGPKRFVPPGISLGKLPPIDAVVISHNHYDHLDDETIRALPNKDRTVAIVPLGLGDFFRERGWTRVVELDWEQSTQVGEVTVTALPAIHFSRRGLFDMRKTLWASWDFAAGGRQVYFSGDTGYGPVFAEVAQRHGRFDLALIAIGAYEPQVIMHPHHLTPEEAVRLGRELGARTLVGMHWGTIRLTEEPPFEPPVRFLAAGRAAGYGDDAIWIMKIGETRTMPWSPSRAAER